MSKNAEDYKITKKRLIEQIEKVESNIEMSDLIDHITVCNIEAMRKTIRLLGAD